MGILKGKIAIITGASRLNGIGAAVCREFACNGCHVFFTYWPAYDNDMPWGVEDNEPERLKEELIGLGVKVSSMEMDLTKFDELELLLAQVEQDLGFPDILVNNAAYSTNTNFAGLTSTELIRHMNVNVAATTLMSAQFAKRFKKGAGGRIINLTSGQFQGPMPGELAYAATKGAIDALTITLAAEVAPFGITVNAVNPGPTDTGWMTEEILDGIKPLFPTGRVGRPSDAAKVIKFLASDDAEWITGQIIHSEGGFMR